MRPSSTDDLLVQVRALIVAHFGEAPTDIALHFASGRTFSCPFLPLHEHLAGSDKLTECERDVVEVLAETDLPQSTEEILRALAKAGRIHGDSTVMKSLAALTRRRILNNGKGSGEKGYRLVE